MVLESDGAGVQTAGGGGSGVGGVGQGVDVGVVQQSSNNITQVNFETIFTKKNKYWNFSLVFRYSLFVILMFTIFSIEWVKFYKFDWCFEGIGTLTQKKISQAVPVKYDLIWFIESSDSLYLPLCFANTPFN